MEYKQHVKNNYEEMSLIRTMLKQRNSESDSSIYSHCFENKDIPQPKRNIELDKNFKRIRLQLPPPDIITRKQLANDTLPSIHQDKKFIQPVFPQSSQEKSRTNFFFD